MKNNLTHHTRLLCLSLLACALCPVSLHAGQDEHQHTASARQEPKPASGAEKSQEAAKPVQLPPLPAGVTELKFGDFFVQPVGARGLELTETLRRLDGKRVRILGYMVQPEKPVPGMFVFTAIPVRVNEERFGDDLPPAALFVSMPKDRGQVVPHTPELLLLTGTLSVGNREEADDRVSTVRLALEIPEPVAKKIFHSSAKGAEQLMRRGK